MSSLSICLKTKSRIASPHDLRDHLKEQWTELARNRELDIVAADGARGGIVLDDTGQHRWEAVDKDGSPIAPVERRRNCGLYQLVLNALRGRRPGGAGAVSFGPSPQPQPDGFYSEQPGHPLSIKRRSFVGVDLGGGRQVALVRNGFPFNLHGHWLALIAKFTESSIDYPWGQQFLSFEIVKLMFDLAAVLGREYCVAFNPPLFGATQWQLHFHVARIEEHPVERAVRVPLAGGGAFPLYPAGCLISENSSPATFWAWIRRLQEAGISANLLVRDRCAYLFPRRPGVGVLPGFPAGMIAFSELAGVFICSSSGDLFEALDEHCLREAHRRTTLPVDEVWPIAVG